MSRSLIFFAVSLTHFALAIAARADTDAKFFESKVRPILANHCGTCHGETKQSGGLQLTTRAGALKGGDNGAVVTPGDVARSRLIQAVRHEGEVKMPPKYKLSNPEIEALAQWVARGALWPEDDPRIARAAGAANHWAFQPVRKVEPPTVENTSWPRGAIDRFILAKLEEKRLAPARAADKRVLLRRLTFDLTGLPATPADTEAFERDDSPVALERVLDRLLASRQFGERWGRHWLDVARYADSNGLDENFTYYDAWRFRNYVIEAFQHDMPFDQLVREQLAGDLLPSAGQEQRDRQLTATGFLMLGPKTILGSDKEQTRMDVVDEQIDTVGKAFLGLSLGCARCHDHKFDPISTKDYYALAGIFDSTVTVHGQLLHRRDLSGWNLRPLGPDGAKLYADWQAFDDKIDELNKKLQKKKDAGLAAEIKLLKAKPPPKPPLVMAVAEREVIADATIRVRGDVHRHGETVPRGFVSLVNQTSRLKPPAHQSGRRELAEWLIDPANPLTARVAANRIWHHLFGAGLVRTVDDFGRQGEAPSHPELLDYLASRFVEGEWSFKRLIREIVLSRTYQMSAEHTDSAFRADPENRLLWRMNRRRLEVEALRDGILAISGQLDLSPAESTVAHLPDQATGVGDKPHKPLESVRRTVYLPVIRNDLRPEFSIFDFADPQTVSGRRNLTNVAPQSLFLMNSPLLRGSARKLAEKLLKQAGPADEEELVRRAYREVFARFPSAAELRFSRAYLTESASHDIEGGSESQESRIAVLGALCQALLCSSQFLYLD
jgi:mono/diheme cytochrome c family protein